MLLGDAPGGPAVAADSRASIASSAAAASSIVRNANRPSPHGRSLGEAGVLHHHRLARRQIGGGAIAEPAAARLHLEVDGDAELAARLPDVVAVGPRRGGHRRGIGEAPAGRADRVVRRVAAERDLQTRRRRATAARRCARTRRPSVRTPRRRRRSACAATSHHRREARRLGREAAPAADPAPPADAAAASRCRASGSGQSGCPMRVP